MYKNKKEAFLLLFPAVLLVGTFVYFSVALNFGYSLFRWSSFSEKIFVGFSNYTRMFKDEVFWIAIKNTMLFSITSVIFQVGLSLILAAILEEKWLRRFGGFCRTIFFIPSVLSMTIVALLWQLALNPILGFVNDFLKLINLDALAMDWLGNKSTAIWAVIMSSQWQYVGYTMMLFIVAMQKIPEEYYEVASIDGAGPVQRFLHITLPNVREMLLLNLTTTVIGGFKTFEQVYNMTSGGPGRSTEVLGTMLYREGFRNDQMGYASAIGVIIFVLTMLFSVIQIRMYNIDETERGCL